MASIERHHQMMSGIPAPYGSMRDQPGYPQGSHARGAALFQDKCAACHGLSAKGNGTAGRALYPHPADLGWLARIPARESEPYIYWSVAEGGRQFGSDMPSFKTQLSRNDIWALIRYLRSGGPAR